MRKVMFLLLMMVLLLSSCAQQPVYGTVRSKYQDCKYKAKQHNKEVARAKKKVVVPYYAKKK